MLVPVFVILNLMVVYANAAHPSLCFCPAILQICEDGAKPVVHPGECCPRCPSPTEPPTLDCRLVLCPAPDCPNPIPPKPGRCCPTCPEPTPSLVCPPLPKDSRGICVELCSSDDGCPKGQLCCSNGCGHVCKVGVRPGICKFKGKIYHVGQSFPAGDGCNTCTCTANNNVACTEIACLPPSPTCPPDKPPVNCFVDPCRFAKCPAHPNAKCVSDFCGGCNARFFEDGEEVTDTCDCPVKGQVFNECGSACPPNCTTPNPICTRQCVPRCECPRGTVINELTNKCVPVKDCPKVVTSPPDVCKFNGKTFNVGESFPAGDGCNTCTCLRSNRVVCTLIACPPPPTCPPDKPPVNCFVDPCQFAKCPAHPNAKCVSDFCGGCNARFFEDGEEVTDTCDCPVKGQVFNECGSACPPNCTTPNPICTRQCVPRCECPRGTVINELTNKCVPVKDCPKAPPPTCPPDKPPVNCFVDPCRFTKCPAHPNAKCVSDFCGGCNARFFEDGEEVTDTCDCPVKGQVFNECGSACPPNCTTPNPICTRQCVPRCECPRGTVINELTNKCVPVKDCPKTPPPTCPPDKPPVNCFVDPCRFAKCPAHPNAKCVSDFCGGCNARFFEDGEEVTDTCDCPVKGQVFNECGSACPPNCTTPNPICTKQCVPRCECPRGTVINELTNKCVRKDKCPLPGAGNCPPKCSGAYCKRNPSSICSIPGPREIPGCTGSCQVTYCPACYFSKKPRPLPRSCRTCGAPVSNRYCLKKWAYCVGRANVRKYGWPPKNHKREENFRCYRYPCTLRG